MTPIPHEVELDGGWGVVCSCGWSASPRDGSHEEIGVLGDRHMREVHKQWPVEDSGTWNPDPDDGTWDDAPEDW